MLIVLLITADTYCVGVFVGMDLIRASAILSAEVRPVKLASSGMDYPLAVSFA